MQINNNLVGSTLIIVGTMVGAGILALPMVSVAVGFPLAVAVLAVIWAVVTLTALLTLEVNLAFSEYDNSFGTMAKKTLGKFAQAVSWVCILLLLYCLTAAYIDGSSSLLSNLVELAFAVKIPKWATSVIFLIVMGGMVFWSTKAADYCNRFFLSFKSIFLIIVLALLLPRATLTNLTASTVNPGGFLTIIPIFLCSFGFHPVIPSLSNYLNKNVKALRFAIICGTSIVFGIYILWLVATMGVVPGTGKESFAAINSDDVAGFIKIVCAIANNSWVTAGLNLFSNIAMTTSFLGVTLGLFDFLADGFKRSNTRAGRFQTSLLTFTPPLLFVLFFPSCFILALKYAAFFCTILILILPALMAYSLRKSNKFVSPYRVFGGKYLLILVIAASLLLFAMQIIATFK